MHKDNRGRHREIDLDLKTKDLPLKAEWTCWVEGRKKGNKSSFHNIGKKNGKNRRR